MGTADINKERYAEEARQNAIHQSRVDKLARHNATMQQMENNSSSSGSRQCFPSGTMIRIPHGQRDIAALKAGDVVIAVDLATKEFKPRKILRVVGHGNTHLWQIKFSDGSLLKTTSAHSFLSKNGWQLARKIKAGDVIATVSEEMVQDLKTVETSTAADSCSAVFNLIVEEDFTFVADGVVAHSFTRLRWLRTQLWRLAQRALKNVDRPLVTPTVSTGEA